jgi:tetratricopeptide (TPR) repeat protein
LAIADSSRAIALEPDDVQSYSRRGYIRAGLGQMALAIADFDKVIALDPGGDGAYSAYFNRGRAKATTSPDSAIVDLSKAIELKPDFAPAYQVRGQVKAVTGKYSAAIADFDKALTLKPGDADILTGRGYTYFRSENYKQAIADYDKVITQKPDSAVALFFRGGAKNKLGLKKEGERDVAAALKLDPGLGK